MKRENRMYRTYFFTRSQRGAALLVALVALVLIGSLTMVTVSGTFRDRRQSDKELYRVQLQLLLEDTRREKLPLPLTLDGDLFGLPDDVLISEQNDRRNAKYASEKVPFNMRLLVY